MVAITTCVLTVLVGFGHLARAYYTEEYPSAIHISPEMNWMNDPNGLVYHDGKCHLFYQYHPNATTTWGFLSWGHAVSTDVVHWEHLPIALECSQSAESECTPNNYVKTTLFSTIYTSNYRTAHTEPGGAVIREGQQSQSIAYSNDDGLTWTQYEGNPVIESPPLGYEDQWNQFRDPYVFWHEQTSKSIMLAFLAMKQKLLI
ncbi:glycosyl hydrolase [Lipomyces doorenjongii]|uniref:glycosyl hydrolase n=1 Tax=Lipomyces doorenjongii TaxID=383834 RepID=UPI0034CD425E